ncbi:MAG: hypothetical protein RI964_2518 [Pseudomonadota bacterium]|jgi:predicted DNA-binding transcriptional regulator AlpA
MLPIKKVSEMTTLAPASIRRKYRAGTFPAPLKLSERRYAWREDDVKSWLSQLETVTNAESKP